jgi:hypothetical protein
MMSASLRLPIVVLMLSVFSFAQQPLGDIARQSRSQRKPGTRVITNEDLPHAIPPSVATSEKDSEDKAKETGKNAEAKAPAEAQKELEKDYLSRVGKEKEALDLLSRELNVLQRENQIKVAEYYADAGQRLRDPQNYSEMTKKYQEDIAAKQKAVDESKQKLDALMEEAHRAGVSMNLFDK